ncbi:MAG: hypothetical protein WCD49_04125 [Candidatus Acidiferrales bacterium]
MSHAYEQLEERQRLEASTSLVKTYLIEAHALGQANHERVLRTIRGKFTPEVLGTRRPVRIRQTEDQMFFNVQIGNENDNTFFYVDASNPRFWLVHTASKSTIADPLVQKLILNTEDFDNTWLPIQLLTRIAGFGILRGLGLDYDRRAVPDIDFEQPAAPVQFLKMQLWGNRSQDVLAILSGREAFPDATTLSKVKVKYLLDRQDEAFCIADIKYDGKITGRGTSYQSYIGLVTNLYRDYARRILDFEQRFTISVESRNENHFRFVGEPLNFVFSHPIENLASFCEKVFSGAQPFRLMGVPISTGVDSFRVIAIDLHVGCRLTFEIFPRLMRAYLAPGSCGNSLARIYTNLQHYYNSRVEALDGDQARPFEA